MNAMRNGVILLAISVLATSNARGTESPEVYFVPFSHLDLFWGGTREDCLARGNAIIAKAIRLARQSPKFRFLLEDNVFVANYVDTHSGSRELQDLKRLVKEGRIEIAPKWAAIYQDLPDGEAQVRNMAIGKRYARSVFGVDPQVAHLGDLPGYTPQFPQIARQARTRFRKDVADVRATTDGPLLMHWGSDLFAPPDDLVEKVEQFNTSASARLIISTPGEFFRRVQAKPGIPEVSGEIPSSWPNLVSSWPHVWPQIIPATNTLLSAEKFAAVNCALGYADYPGSDFELLWKSLLESMDHNQDGQGGMAGDRRKIELQQIAELRGDEIGSLNYPPPGTYVFRYSLSSAAKDWKASKAYRAGMGWNNPLLPVAVADAISAKSLPSTSSFCSLKQENLVISALKKADHGPAVLLRVYEMEGVATESPVEFLGRTPTFGEVNLLEEDLGQSPKQSLRVGPYAIKTITLGRDAK